MADSTMSPPLTPPPPAFRPRRGDAVRLRGYACRGDWADLRGRVGTVETTHGADPLAPYPRATVSFPATADARPARTIKDVPWTALERDGIKPKRRSPLNLRVPKDTRSEAERMEEGLAWAKAHGYGILRVGQGRAAAICHGCSRQAHRLVQIHCRECGSLGFAPSTNSTAGTPDSFVFSDAWPAGCMLAIEWKNGPHGERRAEQSELEERHRIYVVWDLPSFLRALVGFEREIGAASQPDALVYLGAPQAEEVFSHAL